MVVAAEVGHGAFTKGNLSEEPLDAIACGVDVACKVDALVGSSCVGLGEVGMVV